jgi:CelD/BcsL family acetyltransferase involved in cellulose biosynthesis
VNLIALQSGRATLEINTYDAAFGKLSAGTILIDRCVRWAFAQGRDFDFGPGDQSYKQYWSQGVTERVLNLVLAPTRWGRANRGTLAFALRGRHALRDFRQSPTRAARKRPGLFAAGAAVVGGMAFLMAEIL